MKMLKSIKWYIVFSLIFITAVAAVPLSAHTIQYMNVDYDLQNGRTIFTYKVTSSGGQGGGLSHWVYEWCNEAHIFDTDPDYTEYGNDPTTEYSGMKWEVNDWEEGDFEIYTIIFDGIWPVDPNGARIAFKDGNGNSYTTVPGPACITTLGSLGDYVWVDTNMNGIQDSGENGKAGVTVNLYLKQGGNDIPVGQEITDATGFYEFTDLAAGTYFVKFTLPSGYAFSPKDQGGDNTKDSDANTSTGQTDNISLGEGVTDRTWDAGIYQKSKIIIKKVTDPSGSSQSFDFDGEIDVSLTDGQTSSKFVIPGTYTVNEVVPSGWTLTDIEITDPNGNSTKNVADGSVTFDVQAGETVKAVFYNRQDAQIIIEKQTDPDGSDQEFDFDGAIDVNLTDDQSESRTVAPGTYSVNEVVPGATVLDSL
ncbi:MAG: SdrD B-like domain-containing protein [bacterium]